MMSSAARNACPCDYRYCNILLTINVMYKEKKLYHIGKNKRAGNHICSLREPFRYLEILIINLYNTYCNFLRNIIIRDSIIV